MPRRRTRKTNWRPQEERRLRARSIRRGAPDEKKLARAFIGLALARAEAEAQAQAEKETVGPGEPSSARDEGGDERRGDDHVGA